MSENKMQAMIEQAEKDLLHTYNRYQVVLDHGEGMYLYDVNGKKYLDFMSGIAVFALGYGNQAYNDALKAQIDKILHTIEGALKSAMKHAFLKDGRRSHQIIAMENSFHGRTYGALSVTGNPHYREAFGQMPCDVQFAQLNDLDSVKALVNDETCAVIVEPVQGEGGLKPASEEFLKGLRKLCNEKDILLIFDEIQCGMGRTGSIIGQSSLVAGDHGTTYGGNPFACAAINAVLDQYEALDLVHHVNVTAPYLTQTLEKLKEDFACITERRGVGFMQGLVFDRPVGPIIKDAMDHGLIMINAGSNILRFVPALITERQHIDEMAQILRGAIERNA